MLITIDGKDKRNVAAAKLAEIVAEKSSTRSDGIKVGNLTITSKKYNPNQQRHPKGHEDGGQWRDQGDTPDPSGNSAGTPKPQTLVLSDVDPYELLTNAQRDKVDEETQRRLDEYTSGYTGLEKTPELERAIREEVVEEMLEYEGEKIDPEAVRAYVERKGYVYDPSTDKQELRNGATARRAAKKSQNRDEFAGYSLSTPIIFKNKAKQLAYGAVLVPGEPDFYGDVITKEKIEDVAHEFMQKYRYHDLQHTFGDPVAETVESYISDADKTVTFLNGEQGVLPAGSWCMAVKVADEYWPDVESGKIKGFSIAGVARTALEAVATKDRNPVSDADIFQVPSVNDLEDEDWAAVAVSLVDNPAVGKALFTAIKTVQPEIMPKKRGILETLFGPKRDKVASKATEPTSGRDEVVETAETTTEEGDPNMAGEQNVSMQDLVSAFKSANEDTLRTLFKEAGMIKPEPSEEEKLAAALGTVMQPVLDRLEKLEKGKAQAATDDVDEDEDEDEEGDKEGEESERVEQLEAAVKSLRKQLKAVQRGTASSQQVDDDDDDADYDDEDDGRDLFGRRIKSLKEA